MNYLLGQENLTLKDENKELRSRLSQESTYRSHTDDVALEKRTRNRRTKNKNTIFTAKNSKF